nr:hypothetical protein [Moorella glycerini]
MVKLISHKIAPEMIMEPLGKGFGVGERGNHFQQFYGPLFKFRRDYFLVTLLPEEGLDAIHVLRPTAAVELEQLVVNKEAGLGEEIYETVQNELKGILVIRQEKGRQKREGVPAGAAPKAADGQL